MNIFVIGSGTFGTAISNELARNINNNITIYSRSLQIVNEINSENLTNVYYGGSTLLNTAASLYRHAYEKTKPNNEREPGYQERDYERLVNRMRGMEYRFDAEVDKGIFLFRLNRFDQ